MNRLRPALIPCVCLLLAACGGSGKQSEISRSAARSLAAQSDAIAASLRSGDSCGAAAQAQQLRSHVERAIASGSIPPRLATDAHRAAAGLAAQISCVQPPPPPPAEPAKPKPEPKPKPHEPHGPKPHPKPKEKHRK
jgi:outer membrane biosynthesis protein TonB